MKTARARQPVRDDIGINHHEPEHHVNGAEHYAEAERLLAIAERGSTGMTELANDEISRMTAGAQVHATLAVAAATALPTQRIILTDSLQGWFKAVEGIVPDETS